MADDLLMQPAGNKVDLAGNWALQLDPEDTGLAEAWYNRRLSDTTKTIRLPGSLQSQGYGDDVSLDTKWTGGIVDPEWYKDPMFAPYQPPGEVRVPFWLQPVKYYAGTAWYQREIVVPPDWAGKRVAISLERPHWQTRMWLDDRELGSCDSLSTPHVYELGMDVAPGTHLVTLRIDNRVSIGVGENAHSVSDHTQTNWNGVVGDITLFATDPVRLGDIQVYPNVVRKSFWLVLNVENDTGKTWQARLQLQAESTNSALVHYVPLQEQHVVVGTNTTRLEVEYALGDEAQLWDEFHPALYRLSVGLQIAGTQYSDTRHITCGLREVGTEGTQFTINGRKTFLRGTLECAIFPLTGYPATDLASWKRILRIIKAHGLNHMRFHSWCPPEAAFVAADELGVYFQVECAAWAHVGEGQPVDTWLYAEGERITTQFGNHPSFVLMAYGNEPAGNHREYLVKWVNYWKAKDPRRLHTSGAGWPAIPENQYHSFHTSQQKKARIQAMRDGLTSRINALPPETLTDYSAVVQLYEVPIVSHEIGQWCVYPNFAEIAKYTGVLKARNFELFRDSLAAHHMSDQAHDFLLASGKLQALCYKEEIEAALRTPGFGGFQLLDLHDFPGQGTALVGVLDPFWDEKGYITPEEYSRFCNSTVLLARMAKRVLTQSESFQAQIDIAHFGSAPIDQAVVVWRVTNDREQTVAGGKLAAGRVPIGNGIKLGTVEVALSNLPAGRRYRLEVGLEGYPVYNDWDFWVFPDSIDVTPPTNLLVTDTLNEATTAHLNAGGKVLFLPAAENVAGDVEFGFSSIFWNTCWTHNQAPHTLGILCDPDHPALAHFPTEYHTNWQWWELIHGAAAMNLDQLPPQLRPIIQVIDDWFRNRRLGAIFEAKVGNGSLIACSMDLRNNLEQRPVARQMLHSLLRYMGSEQFSPQTAVTVADLAQLLKA